MNQEQYNAMLTENQIAQDNYANMKAEIDRINQVAALYQQATPGKQNALRWQMTQLLDRYAQLRAGLNDASNRLAQSQANINAYNNELARQQELANQQSNAWQRRRTTNPNAWNGRRINVVVWNVWTPNATTQREYWLNPDWSRHINVVTRNVWTPNQYTVDNYLSWNNSNINTWINEKYPISDAYKNASWINQQVNPNFRIDRTNAYKNRWWL